MGGHKLARGSGFWPELWSISSKSRRAPEPWGCSLSPNVPWPRPLAGTLGDFSAASAFAESEERDLETKWRPKARFLAGILGYIT